MNYSAGNSLLFWKAKRVCILEYETDSSHTHDQLFSISTSQQSKKIVTHTGDK